MSARSIDDLVDDVLAAGHAAMDIVAGLDVDDVAGNRTLELALERALELIGEAARRMGADAPAIEVDWSEIVGMRTMLAHSYERLQIQILYDTATRDVPDLMDRLEAYKAARRQPKGQG